jgi:hypothetical protein
LTTAADAELEIIRARKAVDAEARHALQRVFKSEGWLKIERELDQVGEDLRRLTDFLDHTRKDEHCEAIRALLRDEEREN